MFGFCGFAFFITWRRACVPLFVRPADDDGSGDVPTDAPLIRKGHTVSTAKLGHFPRFTKKKQIFSPSALPNCRYRLAFRTARLHFSGITLRGTKDEIREKHPHGIAGEKKYTYLCIENRRGLLPARTAEGAHRLHTTHTTTNNKTTHTAV